MDSNQSLTIELGSPDNYEIFLGGSISRLSSKNHSPPSLLLSIGQRGYLYLSLLPILTYLIQSVKMPPNPSPFTLEGKVAIVTGASRGIGWQCAFELAKRGARIIATYTSPSSVSGMNDLVQKVQSLRNGATVITVKADLRDPSAPERIISACLEDYGPHIDILVNNAGCELVRSAQDITLDDFSYVYDLNVRACILMAGAVIPHLPSYGGRIINIGSVGGRSGFKDLSLYCSSKAALEGLTRCWAAELGTKGHTVNTVCPGPVPTDVLQGIPKEVVENQMKNTPMENRLGTTDDVAQIVGWLAEEGSRWVTGQAISASGGNMMY